MKFKELNEWALNIHKKNSDTLISLGVKAEKISKVKSILRDGISARCKIVMVNTEKNNKCINEIEEFIKQLAIYGLNVIKEVEAPHAKIEETTVKKVEPEAQPKKAEPEPQPTHESK